MSEITLEKKFVSEIKGFFVVPSYQRGYRWGKEEVTRLLDDMYENVDKNYCLQPIVVKKRDDDTYELIDGQQRLTTIYLILEYMYKCSGGYIEAPEFSLTYDTRDLSESFLADIDISRRMENIDFYFMCDAYEIIEYWFEKKAENAKKSVIMNKLNDAFSERISVIWYETLGGDAEDSIRMFERLNIGRIPLTSAELVKAMFLNTHISLENLRKEEIALQWDDMEKELHHPALWSFLSNDMSGYGTRIDLLLDLIAHKAAEDKEKYRTFFYFDAQKEKLANLWDEIYKTFLLLLDWYEDNDLYHKIGYLIASGKQSLVDIYEASKGKDKQKFQNILDDLIRDSIALPKDKNNETKNYGELSYENRTDCEHINRLLLLFNVESVRQIANSRFPFDKFKSTNDDGGWSLEHIHAQQSEGLKEKKQWKEWLRLHVKTVRQLGGSEELLLDMEKAIAKEKLSKNEFEALQQQFFVLFQGNTEYIHSIANLALLNAYDNAALNNSVFDVKRNKIIDMDKAGKYIPFCTKMVFLKYYTPSDETNLHFWGENDRKAYIEAMNTVLEAYLQEPIVIDREEE